MDQPVLRPHGGYRGLKAFQMAEIVYDGTVKFTDRFLTSRTRTVDQMVQAARSGRQNIAEGSQASGTSSKIELNLIGIARASQEELLLDYEDYIRLNKLRRWTKEEEKSIYIRNIGKKADRDYTTYATYIEEKSAETAANTMICLIHQTCFLLDALKRHLERKFVQEGGFSERLHQARVKARKDQRAN
jgi:restriction system protein